MSDLYGILQIALVLNILEVVLGRECYNFREEPRIRQCEYGCCGNDYEEYCCNATLQIIGSAIGGLIVISIIIGVAYYCYRKKAKKNRQQDVRPRNGILGRLGMRSNVTTVSNIRQPGLHYRSQQRVLQPHAGPLDPRNSGQYNPAYIESLQAPGVPQNGYLYPANSTTGPPLAPTAPMPPPYSMTMAPPPYTQNKPVPPPPEYNSIVSHVGPRFKYGGYSDTMPPAN